MAERLRGFAEVHLVELEAGDIAEEEAGRRLAAAVAGPGLELRAPVQSQVRLAAVMRGQVRVDAEAVDRLNRLPAVSIFTLVDGQAVDAGEQVAGCKVTPLAVPGSVIEDAEAVCRALERPVVEVLGFRRLRTAVIVTERLKPKARGLFAQAVSRKLGWYGADLLGVREVAREADAVRQAYASARAEGAQLILFAGASSIDPLDPAYSELGAAGGELLRLGAPAHPGSMLWLGRLGQATVLGVASCAGFGKNTSLDLLLPAVFASGGAEASDLDRLGHGGLIEAGAGRRFPPYEAPPR
jgi:molybdenum cofactor cytidylyltransferase